MLVIRLQRTGRENIPTYRLVVAEKSKPVKAKYLEIVGIYLPARDPAVFQPNTERIVHWISKGATPSDTVARLLSRQGMKGLEKFIRRYSKRRPKSSTPPALSAAEGLTPGGEAPPASPEASKEASATKEAEAAAPAEAKPTTS